MPDASRSLRLVIPQLFDRFGAASPQPRLPHLETLLARGVCQPLTTASCPRHLFELFGFTGAELPLGAVQRLGEGLPADDDPWFCAAPVHYLAERDRVHLVAAPDLQVDAEEAAALAALFNRHFAAEGWFLEAPHPHRWYLRAPGAPAATNVPLEEAVRRDLRELLGGGGERLQWHRFLNEVQMLFHGSPVNEAREARGEPAINGIWPWGGGTTPRLAPRFDWVRSDDPLARGLGAASGARVESPAATEVAAGDGLVLLCAEATASWWTRMDAGWLASARTALEAGTLEELIIDAGATVQYRVTRRDLKRWWRRRRPVGAFA